ncbi:MAG: hypothetical protein ABEI13_04215 [Candidatus Paceibacteria bacterium]
MKVGWCTIKPHLENGTFRKRIAEQVVNWRADQIIDLLGLVKYSGEKDLEEGIIKNVKKDRTNLRRKINCGIVYVYKLLGIEYAVKLIKVLSYLWY